MNNRDEVVTGIVLMRKYGDTLKTLRGVEQKVGWLNTSGILPRNYKILPYYDRTALVQTTLRTVLENLTVGMALVFLVLLFFLGNFSTALIAAVNIPLAPVVACVHFLMHIRRHVGQPDLAGRNRLRDHHQLDRNCNREYPPPSGERRDYSREHRDAYPARSPAEVGSPIFFFTVVFLIAFLPLFTMRGVEGAIFSPMSHTYAYSLAVSNLLSLTLTPVLASFTFERGFRGRVNRLWNAIARFYHWVFVRILRWPRMSLAMIILIALAALSTYPLLGGEFLPKLEEGNVWVTATMPLTISLEHGAQLVNRMRALFMSFPEVGTVVSQLGRPDSGTETTGFFSCEFSVDLKPDSEWPRGLTKHELVQEIDAKLKREFPGITFDYSQNIEANINEALSGVKGSNSVKVFGADLSVDERIANEVREVINSVPGIASIFTATYRSLGQPNVLIEPGPRCLRALRTQRRRCQCDRAGCNRRPGRDPSAGGRTFAASDLVVHWQEPYPRESERDPPDQGVVKPHGPDTARSDRCGAHRRRGLIYLP